MRGPCGMERHRFGKFFGSIAAVAWRERRERRRRLAAASSEQLRAVAGIRYGNFQFGQNLRIYPARGWYRVQDMYYAREGEGCTPGALRRRRRSRRKVKERTREKDATKGEYVCDVCGGHYEEPGVVARQRLSAPTYSHHPQPIPKTPLWDPPSLHGVLFLPFYAAFSLVPRSLVPSSLPLSCSTFSKHGLSSISTLILIRWERLDWHYRFRGDSWW